MKLHISTAQSIKSTSWKNKTTEWDSFAAGLRNVTRSDETSEEYWAMSKEARDAVKQKAAAFVGGPLKGPKRVKGNIDTRMLLTLDADEADDLFVPRFKALGLEGVLYSTHSHTPEKPRYRLVLPLTRGVSVREEYPALINWVSSQLGVEYFDRTCVEPSRGMYYPTCPSDAEYVYEWVKGEVIDPSQFFEARPQWRDPAMWELSDRAVSESVAKQEDPLAKDSIIGAFCRTYFPIQVAIYEFLGDVYSPTEDPNVYTYTNGSTPCGLKIYDDKFAYSHHATDPAGDFHNHNAFDLVRIHMFGGDTGAMMDFAGSLEEVQRENLSNVFDDVSPGEVQEEDWRWQLERNPRNNRIIQSISNAYTVLALDSELKGRVRFNELTERAHAGSGLPWLQDERQWSDFDDTQLAAYMESEYGLEKTDKIKAAWMNTLDRNRYNPIEEYLTGIEWDGVPRLDTMLIDYLGADDNEYVRLVTRTWMVGAVKRAMEPGCQFDNMLILAGPQGIGKSVFLRALAGDDYFTESLTKMDGSKEASEGLRGKWIVNIDELTALKKKGIRQEQIKNFITRRVDSYRGAYLKHLSDLKRRCVFSGTSNDDDFLDDHTGARRYWPVRVRRKPREVWDGTFERDQIWAEAYMMWVADFDTYLDQSIVEHMQEDFTATPDQVGMYEDFFMAPVPADWYERKAADRLMWMQGDIPTESEEMINRKTISAIEVWTEFKQRTAGSATQKDLNEISYMLRRSKMCSGKIRRRDCAYGQVRAYQIVAQGTEAR